MNRKINRALITALSILLLTLCFSVSVTAIKSTVGTVSKLKATATATTVTLKWKKAENAKGYQISVKKGNKWKSVATVTSTTCKINNLKAGTKYTYRVKAYGKNGKKKVWAKKSKNISVLTAPKKVSGFKGSISGKTATLKWNKTKGATGYKIYQYNSENKKWVELKKTTSLKTTIKNLEAGKTYKFAVKAYSKKDNKTVLSTSYAKITLATNLKAEPVSLIINSYGYGDGMIYIEVNPSNWDGDFASTSQNITLKVNGNALATTATCTVPSKKTGSVYEIKITVPEKSVNSGDIVSFTVPTGIIKNQSGSQYNLSYSSSVTV